MKNYFENVFMDFEEKIKKFYRTYHFPIFFDESQSPKNLKLCHWRLWVTNKILQNFVHLTVSLSLLLCDLPIHTSSKWPNTFLHLLSHDSLLSSLFPLPKYKNNIVKNVQEKNMSTKPISPLINLTKLVDGNYGFDDPRIFFIKIGKPMSIFKFKDETNALVSNKLFYVIVRRYS